MNHEATPKVELAILGGGCFWCLEAIYRRMPGILSVSSGYAGGKTSHPTYEEVCTGTTAHAEVIRLEFDPSQVSYQEILELFWRAHDPTTRNQQGADIGTQYRSIILYHNEEQRRIAEDSKNATQPLFRDPIVTEITPLEAFYPAEPRHQQFYEKHPNQNYNQVIVRPKLQRLKEEGVLPTPTPTVRSS